MKPRFIICVVFAAPGVAGLGQSPDGLNSFFGRALQPVPVHDILLWVSGLENSAGDRFVRHFA